MVEASGVGLVSFNVGGEKHDVLESTIRAKPDALLCTLLDDPARKDKTAPIFVQGDKRLFPYVLAWYRYGSICLPSSISLDEIRRECAFYQLPDDVTIKRERPATIQLFAETTEVLKRIRAAAKTASDASAFKSLAANAFQELVDKEEFLCGCASHVLQTKCLQPVKSKADLQSCKVEVEYHGARLQMSARDLLVNLKREMDELAHPFGLQAMLDEKWKSAYLSTGFYWSLGEVIVSLCSLYPPSEQSG
mmetsp:Transcript_21497/g.39421  ORF Transcript_21497/g.39421 Transcript_21497/m.39421 type:complete len:249 (+) Transcript_21497:68-814(+)